MGNVRSNFFGGWLRDQKSGYLGSCCFNFDYLQTILSHNFYGRAILQLQQKPYHPDILDQTSESQKLKQCLVSRPEELSSVVFVLFNFLSHSPLQMDKASELQHCSTSWLQLSTMPSSWALSQETPRNRANCSTNVARSWRGEKNGKSIITIFTHWYREKFLPREILNNTKAVILFPQIESTHSCGEHTVLYAYTIYGQNVQFCMDNTPSRNSYTYRLSVYTSGSYIHVCIWAYVSVGVQGWFS